MVAKESMSSGRQRLVPEMVAAAGVRLMRRGRLMRLGRLCWLVQMRATWAVWCASKSVVNEALIPKALAAVGVQLVPKAALAVKGSENWLVSGHRPSAADCREQLKLLRRSQQTATPEQAKARMAAAVARVQKVGAALAPGVPADYSHRVADGQR